MSLVRVRSKANLKTIRYMRQARLITLLSCFLFLWLQQNTAQQASLFIVDSSFSQTDIGTYCFHRTGENFIDFKQGDSSWMPLNAPKKWLWPFTVHWLCVQLHNKGPYDRQLKFFLNNVQAGNTKIYVVANGIVDSSMQTGSLLPPKLRANTDRFLSMPFVLKAGVNSMVYIKTYRRQIGITLTPSIEDPGITDTHKSLDYFMIFALSMLLLICIVSLILFVSFPSREAAWFALYTAVTFFFILSASGFGALFCWGNYPIFEENGAVFLGSLGAACIFELSRAVFTMKINYPRLDKFLKIFSIVNVIVSLLGFGLLINRFSQSTYTIALSVIYLLQLVAYLLVFYVSFVEAFKKKNKEFGWFFIVFSFIILLTFMLIFQEVGLVDFNYRFHSVMLAAGLIPQTIIPLIFFIRRVVKMLENRQAEIIATKLSGEQKLLKERLRVSQQLHDDIGSTLSGVSMYSYMTGSQLDKDEKQKAKESLQVIQKSTGEMVDKLKDLVWSVNPARDSMPVMLERIEQYCIDMCQVKSISFVSAIDVSVNNVELPDDQRYQLYLIIKESVNNAVKHSAASSLQLSMTINEKQMIVVVADNGNGFDMTANTKGNGITNIKKRAEEMNADINIDSPIGKGTTVQLAVNLPQWGISQNGKK
jgi:signal transduction histidine kinase